MTNLRPRRQHIATKCVLRALAMAAAALCLNTLSMAAAPSFMAFESGHVRPLARSADGSRLFAVNTPNNTLDVFKVTSNGLEWQTSVPVGLEPVAVAVRSDNEVWVVNHLSDSVSIVSLDGVPHVTRTLLVGDEPRDIVFAGAPAKAFITTAHRGQQRMDPALAKVPGAGDPQLTTPGIGRADVWVFDPNSVSNAMGGVPLRIMTFFADTPRALAVSPDRNTVYVAAFKSGNETASVSEFLVCDGNNAKLPCLVKGKIMPGSALGPGTNAEGKPAPKTGLIVKYNRTTHHWEDVLGRNWDNAVPFNLPDQDVFAVDANALTQKVAYRHVGTTLYNMAVNPVTAKLYVSNTEANNMTRFEGPGKFGGSTVQGKIAPARVTIIDNGNVTPRYLNKHIDYSKLVTDAGFDSTAKNHSLATPLEMAVTKDGSKIYVAAFGSSRVGVFSTAELETDAFNPRQASANYITVSGGGPSGLVLDEARGLLYVMTRFDNAIKVVNLASRQEVARANLSNPEPANIVRGRPFLYDANRSSANGEASCASCHTFGDNDDLAWDLGNPDGQVSTSPIKGSDPSQLFVSKLLFGPNGKINGSDVLTDFHPMKGPMTTQTLRGMRNSGAMHWRGDRSNGIFGISASDSNLSFKNFAVAFEGLLGNPQPMGEADMQAFADFQLNVQMPPNPIRNLDNTLTPTQQRGHDFYFGDRHSDGVDVTLFGLPLVSSGKNCNGCHTVDGVTGRFGSNLEQTFEAESQIMKIPQLRNLYTKIGRFGASATGYFSAPDTGHMGDQVRGYGFIHDGSVDALAHFFTGRVFKPTTNTGFPMVNPDATRKDVSEFINVMDSDLAPIVGQQVTLNSTNATLAGPRIDLLIQRAKTPFVSKELGGNVTECDLVASVVEGGMRRGFLFNTVSGAFWGSDGSARSDASLRALAATPGQEVTYTCTPPGSGGRIAFSR